MAECKCVAESRINEDTQVDQIGNYLDGKLITLCVTGGVAAIETPKIARMLRRYGANVRAFMTKAAQEMVGPTALEWATGNEVVTKLTGKSEHIAPEDLVLVTPATFNTIGKLAGGIADDAVSTKLASALGSTPVYIMPTMHQSMMNNPIVNRNIEELMRYKVEIIHPRMEEAKAKSARVSDIAAEICRAISDSNVRGKKLLVTGGPVAGQVDDVRKITNVFHGRLGIEIAKEGYLRGADVMYIHGSSGIKPPSYVPSVVVREYNAYYEEVFKQLDKGFDAAIFSAAVADYLPITQEGKIPSGTLQAIELRSSKKVIDEVRNQYPELFMVTFKLVAGTSESELEKIARKRLEKFDMIVANRMEDRDENRKIYTQDQKYIVNTKPEAAEKLIAIVGNQLESR